MNDKIVFGQYVNVDSWIHRLDPRCKIIVLFMMMIGIFLISNLWVLLGVFGFILLIVATSKIPLKLFLKSFRTIAMLLVFTTIFQILFNRQGEVLYLFDKYIESDFTLSWYNLFISIGVFILYILSGKIIKKYRILGFLLTVALIFVIQKYLIIDKEIVTYHISVHEGGVRTAILVLFRVLNIISLSALLTFTTKPTDMNEGIEGIFAPFKFMKRGVSIFAMMTSITLRFIPTLLNESQKILKAQASRGVDFNDGTLKEKITQIVSLLVPMFVISYKKAEDLANAMDARAYIPGEDRTRIYELKYKVSDILVYIFMLLFMGSIITLKVMGIV